MPANPVKQVAGRIGGLTRAARYTPEELVRDARAGFLAKWEREADPDGVLSPAERARRADALYRAHMTRLAMKSAQARRKAAQSETVSPRNSSTSVIKED